VVPSEVLIAVVELTVDQEEHVAALLARVDWGGAARRSGLLH
jgi:hypothetical protein